MGHAQSRFHRKVLTILTAAVLAAAGLVLVTSPRADAAVACELVYTSNTWGTGSGGFTASIVVKNTGDPLTAWTLSFTFPGSQQLTVGWAATWTQSGQRVTAQSQAWSGSVATGASFTVGFNGNWTDGNPPPRDFAVNGVPCAYVLIPSPTPSPTPTPTFPSPLRIIVIPTTLSVPEGGQASAQIRLNSQPTRDIIVGTARVQGDTDLAGGPPLTFTPSNWNIPQNFAVTAAEDADTTNGTAIFDTRSSQIPGSSAVLWNAAEIDNDGPGSTPLRILITPTALIVPEGGQGIVQVRLSARPTLDTIVVAGRVQGDTDLAVGGPLTFTQGNWNVPQTILVTAAEDADSLNSTAVFDFRSSQISGGGTVSLNVAELDNDVPGSTASPTVPVDNPFIGVSGYVNADWAANVENSAATAGGSAAERMRRLRTVPTAIWLDRIAKVTGTVGVRGLEAHLDDALAQNAGYVTLVLYDLPDKDCLAQVSPAELHAADNGLNWYKTQYIDAIASIVSKSKYSRLRIATIIEPRSLADLVTGNNYPSCVAAAQSGVYVDGIRHALDRLSPLPNVYTYLDAGHSGWIGWDDNFGALATLISSTVRGSAGGATSLDGIATNVADYIPTEEPFLPDATLMFGGVPLRSATFFEWNPYFDERDYATAMRASLIQRGLSSSIGTVIDTSRNGWGGVNRPTSVSTSTELDPYVNQSRVDRRPYRFSWCNQRGAGVGARPVAAPLPGVDAFLWVKPPGESDGVGGPVVPPGSVVDRMCDPAATNRFNPIVLTNALPNAPLYGDWHHEQFAMLVDNAYPAL
ncbi:glycoside hydrolase family 6 protein [Sphaerisporangium aureirubrum]|uniref:Glucanase n=1 Tax=Sphaerisporangium aureirubrum TaxID=1544736 RepID=A0ABW1N800_9ACTN